MVLQLHGWSSLSVWHILAFYLQDSALDVVPLSKWLKIELQIKLSLLNSWPGTIIQYCVLGQDTTLKEPLQSSTVTSQNTGEGDNPATDPIHGTKQYSWLLSAMETRVTN